MTIRRIFHPTLTIGTNKIQGPELHHLRNVLKAKISDTIELFDGRGHLAKGTITDITKDYIEVNISKLHSEPPPKIHLTLASAIPKYSHQETMIKMCTEVGVNCFLPVIFERSSVREKHNLEKWHRWTIEACKQCQANFLPEIREPIKFTNLLEIIDQYSLQLTANVEGKNINQIDIPPNTDKILIIIGPEGGFTETEKKSLFTKTTPIKISQNILRIETASVVSSSLILNLLSP